jgi:hypothetical protein
MATANIGAELASLPLGSMIAGPLTAAIQAQALAANSTVDFIQQVGLDKNLNVRNVTFNYKTAGQGAVLQAPLLSIIPIPFIRIKDMTVDFTFKINTVASDSSNDQTSKEVKAEASGGFWGVKVSASASYSNTKASESKSSVDKSAELKMHVNAVQDEMPEGLKIVLTAITGALAKSVETPSDNTNNKKP